MISLKQRISFSFYYHIKIFLFFSMDLLDCPFFHYKKQLQLSKVVVIPTLEKEEDILFFYLHYLYNCALDKMHA